MRSHMLAKLESNLEGVLSPGTFQKMKAALKDPKIAKKLDMWYGYFLVTIDIIMVVLWNILTKLSFLGPKRSYSHDFS